MKIVTYNVNGLRQRISQFGSLLKLLNSFDADIICFQETKLRRPELTTDFVIADGYESFFSCTRTSDKGRMGYSGVATFCRVKSAFSSNEVALPISAEEGFTGLLQNNKKDELPSVVFPGLEDLERDELLKIDSEGREDAYTCWPSNTGAEQFNFGSRIDHILSAGPCLHEDCNSQDHNFIVCHVKECDILTQYKRWKPGNTPRWKGGWSSKLEGSDHAPVYVSLKEITIISQHDTPSLSTRYLPMVRGLQQTLVSLLMKRQVTEQVEDCEVSNSVGVETISMRSCSSSSKRAHDKCCELDERSQLFSHEVGPTASQKEVHHAKKKALKGRTSQLSLKSFFQKRPSSGSKVENQSSGWDDASRTTSTDDHNSIPQQDDKMPGISSQDQDELNVSCSSEKERNSTALLQWQRIHQLMQNKIPLCKGHSEPCVSRIVKKAGPNFGRRFYTCARAEGPHSNPEANCGFFKWSGSKSEQK